MNMLRIFLLGSPRVIRDVSREEVSLTPRLEALLGYIVLHRERPVHREVLASLFWGDSLTERSRGSLSTAVWRLRRALEPPEGQRGTYILSTRAGEVGINPNSDVWLDVQDFESGLEEALQRQVEDLDPGLVLRLDRSISLYAGDLLEGFYQDWILRERDRLRDLYVSGLVHLTRYWQLYGEYDKCLDCAHRVLEVDPLQEEAHRAIMTAYARTGRRPLAARQYDICRLALATELGLTPTGTTRELYSHITGQETASASAAVGIADVRPDLEFVLRKAVATLEDTTRALRRALRLAEDPSSPSGEHWPKTG